MNKKQPPPSVRLRTIAAYIGKRERNTVADLYAIGKWLIEAKGLIDRGGFIKWIAANTNLSQNTATRAITTAKRIRAPIELMKGVKSSAYFALTRRKVVRSVDLTERAFSARPSKDGLIGLREMQSAISNLDPDAVHRIEDAKEGPIEALGRQLIALSNDKTIDSLHVSFDREEDDELPTVCVRIYGNNRFEVVTRITVEGVFAAITGEEVRKHCGRCKTMKLPSAFSRGSHNCKVCERVRVGEYTRKKRAKNRETKQRIEEIGT